LKQIEYKSSDQENKDNDKENNQTSDEEKVEQKK
jgi:hypothetical protein